MNICTGASIAHRLVWSALGRGRSLIVLALALTFLGGEVAAAQPARPETAKPNFAGLWRLDPRHQAVANPPRPGPNGLPRGWVALAGYRDAGPPPLSAAALETAKAEMQAQLAGRALDARAARCLPASIFDLMTRDGLLDVYQRQDEVVMISELDGVLPRHIYIGHTHPPEDELLPTVNGHSVASWEGDVLVIDTVGFEADAWLFGEDFIRPSPALHIVERLRLADEGRTLIANWTLTDPATFTRPWSLDLVYRREPPQRIPERVCDPDQRAAEAGG